MKKKMSLGKSFGRQLFEGDYFLVRVIGWTIDWMDTHVCPECGFEFNKREQDPYPKLCLAGRTAHRPLFWIRLRPETTTDECDTEMTVILDSKAALALILVRLRADLGKVSLPD